MSPHLAAAANVNHLWAALLVEELVRQGVGLFVVCPGSRSTPLAVAVAQNPRAEALVHWDERAAAFAALGWGRATGRPAAVITTSGTAVANLLPAAVEADADGVPLLLLTADRPPELRETGANQTVRQPPVFADVARWALDAPVPTTEVPARWVLSTAAHAVHRSLRPPGPVHLNLPFREPLAATPDGTDGAAYLAPVERWATQAAPFTTLHQPGAVLDGTDRQRAAGGADLARLAERLRAVREGVVVYAADAAPELAVAVAAALGWPVLPDVRSPLCVGGGSRSTLVPHADLLLTSAAFREARRPEAVLHVGGRIVSKRLGQFLKASSPSLYVHVHDAPERIDPEGLVTDGVQAPLAQVLRGLERETGPGERREGRAWAQAWTHASDAVAGVLAEQVDAAGVLSEPFVARALVERGGAVVAAASMPIRDVEAYAPGRSDRPSLVYANRGASGIDGTVATAAGVARGTGEPVALLVGDLALLHDQTSLALLRTGPPVVVVAINNDGGGIFHRLPIARGEGALAPQTFEQMFGTPHGLGFRDAARQFGLPYIAPETPGAFEAALEEAASFGRSAIVEVRTDRAEQAALRSQIEAAAAAAVDATLS